MGHKPNNGKGIKPEEKAIAYKHTMENGDVIVAKVVAYKIGPSGNYHAWVQHPVYGCEQMTEREGRLESFTPILAVTSDEVPGIIESAVKEATASFESVIKDLTARLERMEATLATAKIKAAKPVVVSTPTPGPTEELDFLG
jgi:L-amino acid N-acyltransferase YncA